MPQTLKEMLATANAAVEKCEPAAARAMVDAGGLLLDVRDAVELERTGRAEGSHHVPRGMLEFRADPESPFADPEFRRDRPVIVYCASGGRAALAGKLLKDMGFQKVYNAGGLKDWTDAGLPVEEPVDPGM